jgi:DNA-directed RNA polymerase specialized sigma24 family protein
MREPPPPTTAGKTRPRKRPTVRLSPAQSALATAHEHLIPPIVVASLRSAPWAEWDDLYQEGWLGLIDAVQAPTRKVDEPFAQYARTIIWRKIHNSVAFTRGVGADRTLLAIVTAANQVLLQRGVHQPTFAEIAAEVTAAGRECSEGDVKRVLTKLAVASKESVEKLAEEGRELRQGDPPRPPPPRDWGPKWERMLAGLTRACQMTAEGRRAFYDHVLGVSDARIAARLEIKAGALRTRLSRLRDGVEATVAKALEAAEFEPSFARILCQHLTLVGPTAQLHALEPAERKKVLLQQASELGVELPAELMDAVVGEGPGKVVDGAALEEAVRRVRRAREKRSLEEGRQLEQLCSELRALVAAGAAPVWLLDLVEIVLAYVEGAEAS